MKWRFARFGRRSAATALMALACLVFPFWTLDAPHHAARVAGAAASAGRGASWLLAGTRTAAQTGCETQLSIDTPTGTEPVRGVVEVTGWAVDQASTEGSGVDSVQLWL